MEENTLLKLALLTSLIGLLVLYFLMQYTPLPSFNPQDAEQQGDVLITAKVLSVQETGKVARLKLLYYTPQEALYFKSPDESLKALQGKVIEAKAEINEEDGHRQIIINSFS